MSWNMYLIGIIIILFTILMMRSAEHIKGFRSFFKEFWILVARERKLRVNTAVKIRPVFTQQHPIMIYWGKKKAFTRCATRPCYRDIHKVLSRPGSSKLIPLDISRIHLLPLPPVSLPQDVILRIRQRLMSRSPSKLLAPG